MSTSKSYNTARRRANSDPLSQAVQPDPNETPEEAQRRKKAEAEAKKISDMIDEQLKQESKTRSNKKEIKLLLLGQSESGKSTTLKQFQIMYAPSAFESECLAWRPIVYLNLVRSVRRILEALTVSDEGTGFDERPQTASSVLDETSLSQFANIKLKLSPLLHLEDALIQRLSTAEEDEATHLGAWNAAVPNKEVFVRSGAPWKKALGKLAKSPKAGSSASKDIDDPVHILNACKDDIVALWTDPRVQEVLRKRKLRLEESSGFYLNDVARVTAIDYVPSGDDVLKARLKTIGVVEHIFTMSKGSEKGVDWKIIDVGGARNQRHAWAPFFDDAAALIFLAPISAFDQVLAEDHEVNRVEDSLLLWKSLISNKLLVNVNLILFLNKCDLLQKKLDSGIHLATYMTSYADRPNDFESVAKYFRNKFLALHRSYSVNQDREVFVHMTNVTDTATTRHIIGSVRDFILRDSLRSANLL